ncbi:hypothetical protein ACO0K0_02255 [Undibacterium sp. SXout11W]|uniref:hypothetical protein n=1 Tax=Undibacterium sp. SXout11W TaxID=3413050 RepID=UPI003BF0E5A3
MPNRNKQCTEKFCGELSVGGALTQFGRRLLDDFVNNNQASSPDSNGYLRWLAGMVDGRYEKPDSTSANGVVATVGAAAAMMLSPSGPEAKIAKEIQLSRAAHGEAVVSQ